MIKENSNFVNLQKMIGIKLESQETTHEPMSINASMHLSSYELVNFLRQQMHRADDALTRHELNMSDVSRIAKKKL